MLFGHQNDVNQPQPDAADQNAQDLVNPQDHVVQTVPPQDAGAVDTATPQDATAGVNPLAVDPATGASLPTVPTDNAGPANTPAPAIDEPLSVLDQQPSVPSADVVAAPSAAPVENESAIPDPASPFGTAPEPAPEDPQVAQETASPAGELDTPGEDPEPASAPEDTSPGLMQGPVDNADEQSPAPAPSTDDTATPDDTGTPVDSPAPAAPSQDNSHLLDLKQQAIAQLSPLINHLDQGPEEKFRTTMMLLQSTDNPALLHDAYTAAQSISDDGARAQALLDVVNEINYFTQQQSGN